MRLVLPLLAAPVVIVPVACGGGDDTASGTTTTEQAALTLSQRLVTAEDAPGSKPDPVEQGGTTVKFDEFIQALSDLAIDPDTTEMTTVLREAGFKGAGSGTRFFESNAYPYGASCLQLRRSPPVRRRSDERSGLARNRHHEACPMSCAVQRSTFDVDDIPRDEAFTEVRPPTTSRGSEHQTNDPSKATGWASPTVRSSTRWICTDHQGSVTEERAQTIANAYYERLKDN